MTRKINKIKLFVKEDSFSVIVSNLLKEKLLKNNFILVEENYDLAISIGGDGTFINMVSKNNFSNKVVFIGINSGNLGFLENIEVDKIDNFVKSLNNNDFRIEEKSFVSAKLISGNEKINCKALNEIVIRNKHYKALSMSIYIDDNLLEEFVGDGILIGTPTGSTAYNLSLGGPVIYDLLDVLTLTPIAPINNDIYQSLRNSIIIPKDKMISLIPNKTKGLIVICDGKEIKLNNVKKIKINIDDNKIKCLRMNDYSFEKVLYRKIIK